jgi:hypothetical protein
MMKPPRTPLKFDIDRSPITAEEVARATAPATAPRPSGQRQQIGARIPIDTYRKLKVRAVMEGALVQDLVERAIVEFLERSDA